MADRCWSDDIGFEGETSIDEIESRYSMAYEAQIWSFFKKDQLAQLGKHQSLLFKEGESRKHNMQFLLWIAFFQVISLMGLIVLMSLFPSHYQSQV